MIREEEAFTLVELLVTLALTGLVMAVIYKSFATQQKVYTAQDEVAVMQQDLRAAMEIMVRDIRMAGYNPRSTTPTPGFTFINLPTPGTPNYGRYTSSDGVAFNTDTWPDPLFGNGPNGVLDASDLEQKAFRLNVDQTGAALVTPDNILRSFSITGASAVPAQPWQPLAENIQAIGFAYAFDNDGDGQLDTAPGGGIIWAIDTNSPPVGTLNRNLDTNNDGEVDAADNPLGIAIPASISPTGTVNITQIRAVKLWVLARSQHWDKDFRNNTTYVVSNQRITPNDNYRRRLLTATVKCRNMGLMP